MDKKALSLPMLIAMVVGNMIGTGIFILPASLAPFGTLSILSWVITSFGALLLALTFTHLNKRYSETGGPYAYCKQAFGHLSAFIVAIIYWFSQVGSIAGLAIASVGYLGYLFPALNANTPFFNPTILLCVELAIIWALTIVNMLGIHFSGLVQLWLTTIKLIPLIVVIVFGMSHIHLEYLTHFTVQQHSPLIDLSRAAAITFWAFVGLEAATVPAENTSGPKDITRATIYGTSISAIIYIASTIVLMGMIPIYHLMSSQFPFAEAGAMLFGPFGALLIAVFACISGIGALNVCIFLQGQIIFSAARDKLLPRWLAKCSKQDVPYYGIICSSIVTSLLLVVTVKQTLLQQFTFVILLASLLTLIVYLLSACAEIKFALQENKRRHWMKKSLWTAFIAASYTLVMILSIKLSILMISLCLIGGCIPIYYLFVQRKIYE